MKSARRQVISIAAIAIVVGFCSAAEAQQPKRIPRIGYLTIRGAPSDQDEGIKQGLRELGWIEGQNFTIEWRGAAGRTERLSELATDLVRMKVDVIVATATPSVQAAKRATNTIPIVMSGAADPVGVGFVSSLSHPGGNITGLSLQSPELAGKRMELLQQIIPKLQRVAFLAYRPDPAHRLFIKEAQEAGEALKVEIQPLLLADPIDIENAFANVLRERAGALVIQPLFLGGLGHGEKVVELAKKNRLPSVSDGTQFAEIGGLVYYGPSRIELFRRTSIFIDKILKGAKPADLPVEQPTKFELIINLKTAKQIGLTIPPNVLARADRVIK